MKSTLWLGVAALLTSTVAFADIQKGDNVVFCGDSITCMGKAQPWGYRFQMTNALAKVRGWNNNEVGFVNLGFCGNGVRNWLGIEKGSKSYLIQANDHSRAYASESVGETFSNRVDVLVLSLGMNDMLCPFIQDKPEEITAWLADFKQLVQNLRERTKPRIFVVATIQPLTNDPDGAKNRMEQVLNAGIIKIAEEEKVLVADYHKVLMETLERVRAVSTDYQDTPDFVHPRELGNIAMAMEVARVVGANDLYQWLDNYQKERLAAIVRKTTGKISYRVFPKNLDDVKNTKRVYNVTWTRQADGVKGATTIKVVPEKARNVVSVDEGEVVIPAVWRVSEPMPKDSKLADVKQWKILAPTHDYVGGDDPWSVDYMQSWFGREDDTIFATRKVWSAKARSVPFKMKTDAFSNTYHFTVYLNGLEIWQDDLPRGTNFTKTQGVLELKEGWNDLVIRQDHQSWQRQFAVQLLPQNGDTLDDLKFAW